MTLHYLTSFIFIFVIRFIFIMYIIITSLKYFDILVSTLYFLLHSHCCSTLYTQIKHFCPEVLPQHKFLFKGPLCSFLPRCMLLQLLLLSLLISYYLVILTMPYLKPSAGTVSQVVTLMSHFLRTLPCLGGHLPYIWNMSRWRNSLDIVS